jgi:hypothetical protein
MSTRRKASIVHGALALLALWPLAHIALQARFDLSPWKLAGWGMYAAPRFGLIGMEVYGRAEDGEWEQLVAPSPELQGVATDFLERHRWLRKLASAGELLAAVRRGRPAWDTVKIVVSYPEIERSSGMVVLVRDERLSSVSRAARTSSGAREAAARLPAASGPGTTPDRPAR